MPGELRSTSLRLAAPCSLITLCGITEIVCGVSRNGWVNLGEEAPSLLYESCSASAPTEIFGNCCGELVVVWACTVAACKVAITAAVTGQRCRWVKAGMARGLLQGAGVASE